MGQAWSKGGEYKFYFGHLQCDGLLNHDTSFMRADAIFALPVCVFQVSNTALSI